MSIREAFAANLARLCESEKSIAAVCRSTKINRQQFNRYLSGVSLPSEPNLRKICTHFGIDEPELFEKSNERQPRSPGNGGGEPWSHPAARALLKRLYNGAQTSVEPGLYFAHFAYPPDPSSVMRSTVIVRRDGNLTTFRRLTGRSEPNGSWWSRYQGDHLGVVMERRHWLYFIGVNTTASEEPTELVLRWVPDADPVLGGFATIMMPDGPTVTAVVLNKCPVRTTLRSALKASHVYSVDDARLTPSVVDVLDQQCAWLNSMVRRLDFSVTPLTSMPLPEARRFNGRR